MNIQEAYRTPNKVDQKRKSSCHIIIKTLKTQNKKKIRVLKAASDKSPVIYKCRPVGLGFSKPTLISVLEHFDPSSSQPSKSR